MSEPHRHCKRHKSHFRTDRDRRKDQECHISQFGTTDPCCILTPASFRSSLQSLPWKRKINRSPAWQSSQDLGHVTPHLPPPQLLKPEAHPHLSAIQTSPWSEENGVTRGNSSPCTQLSAWGCYPVTKKLSKTLC